MIVVTGAFGFIGSCLVHQLNEEGHRDLIVVDDFYKWKKENNLLDAQVRDWVHRDIFLSYFSKMASRVEVVFHLGARTDTVSEDHKIFQELNLNYSKEIWKICSKAGIPLVYASSAATYGSGENGFSDDHAKLPQFRPLNPYAVSKHEFDLWALQQKRAPPSWYGLKFFNVYGPNEYHKGRMASVIYHAFHQIRENGKLNLFKSHIPQFADGGQMRDFIYVKDVLQMIMEIKLRSPESGIYNVGTGQARSFADLGKACFSSLHLETEIGYIDMPEDLRHKYQYFTEADMNKWKAAGLQLPGTSLESGIRDYIANYLIPCKTI